ncbi:hypothetical protein ACJW31_11G121300 [Castanea mollissima]
MDNSIAPMPLCFGKGLQLYHLSRILVFATKVAYVPSTQSHFKHGKQFKSHEQVKQGHISNLNCMSSKPPTSSNLNITTVSYNCFAVDRSRILSPKSLCLVGQWKYLIKSVKCFTSFFFPFSFSVSFGMLLIHEQK